MTAIVVHGRIGGTGAPTTRTSCDTRLAAATLASMVSLAMPRDVMRAMDLPDLAGVIRYAKVEDPRGIMPNDELIEALQKIQ